jgi:hypothetical protein
MNIIVNEMESDGKLSQTGAVDALSRFLEDAQHNTTATCANLGPHYKTLTKIDRLFRKLNDNLDHNPHMLATWFFFRTHSALLGSIRLCCGCQVGETYMVLRGCLESALYGIYVARDSDRQSLWLRRGENEATKKKVQEEFTVGKVMKFLHGIDPETQTIAKALYDRTIDLGGHPNERAFFSQIKTQVIESRVDFTASYFNCGDLPHELCIRTTAQIGVCCLDIFSHVFGERFRILGIDCDLDHIRNGL